MPRRVDRDQRRRELAIAVWGIVAERGIEGVTLRAVAKAADVSVGRVQHYYENREELVRDSCRVMIDLAADGFEDETRGLPAMQALRMLVLHPIPETVTFAHGAAVWTAYLAKSVDDPGIAKLVRESHRGGAALAAELVEQARADGALRPGDDAHELALELLALSEGCTARVLSGSLTSAQAVAALEGRLARELRR